MSIGGIILAAAAVGSALLIAAMGFAWLFQPRVVPSEHEVI